MDECSVGGYTIRSVLIEIEIIDASYTATDTVIEASIAGRITFYTVGSHIIRYLRERFITSYLCGSPDSDTHDQKQFWDAAFHCFYII